MPTVTTRVTTAPATEILAAEDAKAHLRLDTSDEDIYVEALCAAARAHAENYCNRGFVTQTVTLTADGFPRATCDGRWAWDGDRQYADAAMRLPWGRVRSVASVTYVDTSGATQTLAPSAYHVDLASELARVSPVYGTCWPITRCQTGAVTVVYDVGYGDAAGDVPVAVRQALLLLVGHFYEQRTPVNVGNIVTTIPMSVEALLAPYRVLI